MINDCFKEEYCWVKVGRLGVIVPLSEFDLCYGMFFLSECEAKCYLNGHNDQLHKSDRYTLIKTYRFIGE